MGVDVRQAPRNGVGKVMGRYGAVMDASVATTPQGLFARIGAFLDMHRLDCEPANYAFAHSVLSNPDSALAQAVARLVDGGVRLTKRDIESLGGEVAISPKEARREAEILVARTQMQVESFDDTISAMRAETQDFGRELAASADALARTSSPQAEDVGQIIATMIGRVHSAEAQLERATAESRALRDELEEARDNARRDPLTELPNRRALEEAYSAQSAAGVPLCVAVCDVDHFKSVNDRFGHVVGDRVLKTIGSALAEACTGHVVARYGGEEFAVLFVDISVEEASRILDRARLRVSGKHYRLRETDEPLGEITFSGGISAVGPGEGFGTVFHRADRMLYSAKDAGRNRILAG